jgi:hypothetical protein
MNVILDVHRLGGLRWIVLRGPGREAFRASASTPGSRDLAEGHPHAQRSFIS